MGGKNTQRHLCKPTPRRRTAFCHRCPLMRWEEPAAAAALAHWGQAAPVVPSARQTRAWPAVPLRPPVPGEQGPQVRHPPAKLVALGAAPS
jgi:hypothetical protein